MDIFTPTKSPEAPTPKPKRKKTQVVRLQTEQIIDAAQDAQFVGERAKKRKVEGNETKYLGALLRDLAGLAHRTEPDLSLAQFMVAAQQIGRTRALKVILGDRRTSAFRSSLASSKDTQPILSPLKQSDYEDEDDEGRQNSEDCERRAKDSDDVDARADGGRKGLAGISKRLDMSDGADDALKDFNSLGPVLDVDRCGTDGAILREKEGVAAAAGRSAPALDMDIDPQDIIEAEIVKGGEANGKDDEMDIDEYEMNLMLEFEENGGAM